MCVGDEVKLAGGSDFGWAGACFPAFLGLEFNPHLRVSRSVNGSRFRSVRWRVVRL